MARASDGPASSADLGWRSKDLTELLLNIQRWMLERGRISCQRQSYTSYSETEHNVTSFC